MSDSVDPLVEAVLNLNALDRRRLVGCIALSKHGDTLPEKPPLPFKQTAFVASYAADCDRKAAAEAAGYKSNGPSLSYPPIAEAVRGKMKEYEARCALKADYVRDYIFSILELCPTDYLTSDDDGDWVIDPERFSSLPHEIKRLVEGVELKMVRGRCVYKVNFMSKTAALRMAAQFTLTQKVEAAITVIPWDQVQGIATPADPIEDRLAALENRNGEASRG